MKLSSKISLAPLLRQLSGQSHLSDRIEGKVGLPHESSPCLTNLGRARLSHQTRIFYHRGGAAAAAIEIRGGWKVGQEIGLVETGC